jgi:carboxyl-terminal processing protease
VLVDGGSASASEIVTGAMRDSHRATLVGERTFGKGVFQELEPLSNGGALDLTVGSYYLPSGENISKTGIKPEVKARDKPRTMQDEALPVAIDELVDQTK